MKKGRILKRTKKLFALLTCFFIIVTNFMVSFATDTIKASNTPVEDYGILTSVKITTDSEGKREAVDGQKWHVYGSVYVNYTWRLNGHTSGDIVTFDLPDALSSGSKPIRFYLYAPDGETKVGLVEVPKDSNHVTVTFLDDPDKEGDYLKDHTGVTGTMQFAAFWKSGIETTKKEVTFIYDKTSKSYNIDIYKDQGDDAPTLKNINKWGFYYNENGKRYVTWEVDINSALESNVDFSKGTFTEQLGPGQKIVEDSLKIQRRYWDSSTASYQFELLRSHGKNHSAFTKYIKSFTMIRDSNSNATGFYIEFVDGPINGEFLFGFDSVTLDGVKLGPTEYTNYAKFTKNDNEVYEVNANSIDRSGSGNAVGYKTNIKLKKLDETNNTALKGAEFKLVKGATADGEILREHLVTDANGEIKIDSLSEGTYSLVETKAPLGYKLDTTPQTFEIDYSKADSDRILYIDLFMTNALLDNSIQIIKNYEGFDEKLKEEDLAEFTIYRKDGTVVGKMNRTDHVYIYQNIAGGSYYIEETKVPTGYEKAEKLYFVVNPDRSIKITNSDTSAAEVTQSSPYEVSAKIENKIRRGQITLVKHEFEHRDKALQGAVFKLQKKELGTYVDVVGKTNLLTDKKGKIVVKDLLPGEYQFVETKAPEGYLLDKTPIIFKIGPDSYEVVTYKSNKKRLVPKVKGSKELNSGIKETKKTTDTSQVQPVTSRNNVVAPKTMDKVNALGWMVLFVFSFGCLCFMKKKKRV